MLSIDSELVEAVAAVAAAAAPTPPVVGDWKTRRATIDAFYSGLAAAGESDDHVEIVDFTAPSRDGHAVPLRLYKPSSLPNALIVHIHGGGLIAGSLDGYDHVCRRYTAEAGVAMIAVDYRLAPESPFPAALEDCVAAVQWAIDHAAQRLPGAPVAVMGDSAGGGLAAATALVCRDRGIGALSAQILIYPMLDDRTTTADPAVEPLLAWSAADNITGWRRTSAIGTAPRTCRLRRRLPALIRYMICRQPISRSVSWTCSVPRQSPTPTGSSTTT